jgi:hypothetical protein
VAGFFVNFKRFLKGQKAANEGKLAFNFYPKRIVSNKPDNLKDLVNGWLGTS